MIFRQLFDKNSSTYTYIIADSHTRAAAIIDPVLENTQSYLQLLHELDLSLKYAMDTHTHADHITALGKLREATGCETLLGRESNTACASDTFTDLTVLTLGRIEIQALYTPGHTDDSYCFFVNNDGQKMLFTGDTLLIRGTGRTDFQNGDAKEQYKSLQRLLKFDDTTLVYPGHDYKGWNLSTILEEKQYNPRLKPSSAIAYSELMATLNLPDPKMMDIAVPANRACGNTVQPKST